MTEKLRCNGVTKQAGMCKRTPTTNYVAKDGTVVARYCTQHAAGAGVMKMLKPFPWDYDRIEKEV